MTTTTIDCEIRDIDHDVEISMTISILSQCREQAEISWDHAISRQQPQHKSRTDISPSIWLSHAAALLWLLSPCLSLSTVGWEEVSRACDLVEVCPV
jgi:hypothetical protein